MIVHSEIIEGEVRARLSSKANELCARMHDDLMQEALFAIFSKSSEIDSQRGSPKGFCYTVGVNAMIDYLRKNAFVLSGRVDGSVYATSEEIKKKGLLAMQSTLFFSEVFTDSEGHFAEPPDTKTEEEELISANDKAKLHEIKLFLDQLCPVQTLIFWQVFVNKGRLTHMFRNRIAKEFPDLTYPQVAKMKRNLATSVARFKIFIREKYKAHEQP